MMSRQQQPRSITSMMSSLVFFLLLWSPLVVLQLASAAVVRDRVVAAAFAPLSQPSRPLSRSEGLFGRMEPQEEDIASSSRRERPNRSRNRHGRRLGQDKNVPAPTVPPTKNDKQSQPQQQPENESGSDNENNEENGDSNTDDAAFDEPPPVPDFERPPVVEPTASPTSVDDTDLALPPVLDEESDGSNGSETPFPTAVVADAPSSSSSSNSGTDSASRPLVTPAPKEPAVSSPSPPPPQPAPTESSNGNGSSSSSSSSNSTTQDVSTLAPTALPVLTQSIALATFDVVVVATLSKTEDRAEQLRVYRKHIRTSLQDYLLQSLRPSFSESTGADATASTSLVHVLLRVVETRTERRWMQQQQEDGNNQESNTEDDDLATIEQVFSYAGDAVFLSPAPADASPTALQEMQVQALGLTSDVQRAIDGTLLQNLVTLQAVNMWNDNGNNSNEADGNGNDSDGDDATDDGTDSTTTSPESIKEPKFDLLILIASTVVGVVIFAVFCGTCLAKWCQHRRRRNSPPPLITATTKQVSGPSSHTPKKNVEQPFSPYGKEDTDQDIQRIVSDLESLEESWHDGPPPNRPYLQLTVTGATSADESKDGEGNGSNGGGSYAMSPMGTVGTTTTTTTAVVSATSMAPLASGGGGNRAAATAPGIAQVVVSTPPVTIAPVHQGSVEALDSTRGEKIMYKPDEEDEPMRILSIHKVPEEKKEDERATAGTKAAPSLYATPVIAMSGSGDSMDGYSLHSGFYGGARSAPASTNATANTNPNLLQDYSPPAKTRPAWMTAPRIAAANKGGGAADRDSGGEYTSDSESQFSYNNIGGMEAKSTVAVSSTSALGPALYSMSTDSDDTAPPPHHHDPNDELMLTLNRNQGIILSDSPSFPKRQSSLEHIYQTDKNDTPVAANNTQGGNNGSYLPAPYSAGGRQQRRGGIDTSDDDDADDEDDDDPLRTAALSRGGVGAVARHDSRASTKAAASSASRMRSASPSYFYSVAAGGALGRSMHSHPPLPPKSGDRCLDESESQPSDEMMEDSMAQDLEGFADELARIKRDIGLSSHRSRSDPSLLSTSSSHNTPVTARWGNTSRRQDEDDDEYGRPPMNTTTMVTPDDGYDDESRLRSARHRRRNV